MEKQFDGGGRNSNGGGDSEAMEDSPATSSSSNGSGRLNYVQLREFLLSKDKCSAAKNILNECMNHINSKSSSTPSLDIDDDSSKTTPSSPNSSTSVSEKTSSSLLKPKSLLADLLNILLSPQLPTNKTTPNTLSKADAVEWLKWLMAGGRTPDDFYNTGK